MSSKKEATAKETAQRQKRTAEELSGGQERKSYTCEGFVKEIEVVKGKCASFTLEPVAPYMFEKKADDGKVKRCLLFIDGPKNSVDAKVLDCDSKFVPPKPSDFNTLLILKASRMKIRLMAYMERDEVVVAGLSVL